MSRPRLDIPGPRELPGIGSLPGFARDPLAFCARMQARYGDLVQYRLGKHTLVQVNHPAQVEEVLLKHWRVMHKDAIYELMRPLLGNGLVTAEGDAWKRNRKLAAPSFSKRHVEVYAADMALCAREYAEGLRDGDRRDVHADMMGLAQRIVLRTLFGELDVQLDGVAEHIETVMDAFVREIQGPLRFVPRQIPTRSRRRADRAIAALDGVVHELIAARRAAGLGEDLLSRLLEARDDEGRGMDDQQLRDEAVTMFVAGHETTAVALTFAFLLLGRHPDALRKVQEELDAVLDGPIEVGHLARLPYTRAVLKESMRLLPPVWGIGREAQADVEVGGHHIPAGVQLFIVQWTLHRDARFYQDPLSFRPERWLDGLDDRLPRMAYLPFGGGPRICIGNHFAMMEAMICLASVLRVAALVPTGPNPAPLVASITLRPKGPVPVRVARRSPSS